MERETDTLRDLSRDVSDAARTTAFALMKANYTERDAPELPEGKIEGLEGQARDLAVRLRESIWYRFDTLCFYHRLLQQVHDGYASAVAEGGPSTDNFKTVYSAVLREQALFDGLVFNAVSLFDYLGNAVWFGFHGQNYVKKKWKRAYKAARDAGYERNVANGSVRINGSASGEVIVSTHRDFVGKLTEYRADLFHYQVDSAGGGVVHSFEAASDEPDSAEWSPELRVSLPEDYVDAVGKLLDSESAPDKDRLLLPGSEMLIRRVGESTLSLLNALQDDLDWEKEDGLTILS